MSTTTDQFERALGDILARVFFAPGENRGITPSFAVAYSGGLDSSALLHLARAYASDRSVRLFAFHVHHGISHNADAWLAHCERECMRLGVPFDARRVTVRRDGDGVEAAARAARYAALADMCRAHEVPLLLTAHHRDDQAETVLLQLLRGAGVAGLSGMDALGTAPDLLGGADLTLARPLLPVSRAELTAYMKGAGAAWIEDETNIDPRYARNALRQQIVPLLEMHFPGFPERVARSAQHAQFAQRLLDELARDDLKACRDGDGLDADGLRRLSADRAANLMRHWLAERGLRMPTTAWLHEALAQLLGARQDAQVCITLEDCEIRRHRNLIVLVPASEPPAGALDLPLEWQGEIAVPVPEFGGLLRFEPAEEGVDADWLRAQPLRLRSYRGEARLKLVSNRPSRSLKSHCQELGIPAWERRRLPLLYAGGELLFAAGIGTAWRHLGAGGRRVRIVWIKAGESLPL